MYDAWPLAFAHVVDMSGRLKHKSGPLKQKNKAHKSGRHKTKGELNADHKGNS